MSSGHTAQVNACAVSPDGSFFVSASADNTVRLWDSSSGEPIRTLPHPDEVLFCAVGPDNYVYSAGSGLAAGYLGCVMIWDPATGNLIADWNNQGELLKAKPRGLALSAAGDLVALFDDMENIDVLDPIHARRQRRIDGSSSAPRHAFFAASPDGGLLVATMDAGLRVVVPATGETITSFENGHGPLAIAPDARTVVFNGSSGWTVGEIPSGGSRILDEGRFERCAISPDGTLIAAAFQKKEQSYSSLTGASVRKIGTTALRIRRADPGDLVRDVDLGDEEATLLAFSPDASLIFVAGPASLRIFDVSTGDDLGSIPLESEATCLVTHPSRPIVALGDAVGGFHVLDVGLDMGRIVATAAIHGEGAPEIRCPACSAMFDARDVLGKDVDCPSCRAALRVTPFVLRLRPTPSRPPSAPHRTPTQAPPSAVSAASPEAPPQISDINEEVKSLLFEQAAEAGVNLEDYPGKIQELIVASTMNEAVKGLVAQTEALLDATQRAQLGEAHATGNPLATVRFLHETLPDAGVLTILRDGLRAAYPVHAAPGGRAKMFVAMGQPDEALPLFEEQQRLSAASGDRAVEAESMGNRAVLLKGRGEIAEASSLHEQEERILREIGEKEGLARSLRNQVLILRAAGRDDDALSKLEESEAISRELGDRAGLAQSLGNRAEILGNRGRIDDAIAMLSEAATICRELGDWQQLAASLAGRGVFLAQTGRTGDALAALEDALSVANEHGLAALAQQIQPFVHEVRQHATTAPKPAQPSAAGQKRRDTMSVKQQVWAILQEEIDAAGIDLQSYPEDQRTRLLARAMQMSLGFIVETAAGLPGLDAAKLQEVQRLFQAGDVDPMLEILNGALPPGDFLAALRTVLKQSIPAAALIASQPVGAANPFSASATAAPEKQKRGLFRRKRG